MWPLIGQQGKSGLVSIAFVGADGGAIVTQSLPFGEPLGGAGLWAYGFSWLPFFGAPDSAER